MSLISSLKMTVAKKHKFIREFEVTSASVHDSEVVIPASNWQRSTVSEARNVPFDQSRSIALAYSNDASVGKVEPLFDPAGF